MIESLGLPVVLEVASDPFFGRGGRMMKSNQMEQELKFELLVNIWGKDHTTAVASFNYHQDHFAHLFGIYQANGEDAHRACIGFGMDRLIIALLKTHGFIINAWPHSIQSKLGF